jgi:hypothetical protein
MAPSAAHVDWRATKKKVTNSSSTQIAAARRLAHGAY